MTSVGYPDTPAKLSLGVQDMQQAISSLMEEFDAIEFYDQRVEACTDPALKALLASNRDAEKKHAAMLLEWIRRNDACLDQELRECLFANTETARQ